MRHALQKALLTVSAVVHSSSLGVEADVHAFAKSLGQLAVAVSKSKVGAWRNGMKY